MFVLCVQSYNTLLTLSHLAQVSDGIVLLENEALHRTAHRLYNLPRPSFQVTITHTHTHTRTHTHTHARTIALPQTAYEEEFAPTHSVRVLGILSAMCVCVCVSHCAQDMNHVAAKSLASLVLPSFHRPATGTLSLSPHNTSTSPSNNSAAGGGGRGVGGSGAAVDSRMKRQSSGVGVGVGATQETRGRDSAAVVDQRVLPHGTVGVHDTTPGTRHMTLALLQRVRMAGRQQWHVSVCVCVCVCVGPGRPVRLLSELLSHCTPHPAYRVLSLRSLPQVG